MMLTEREVLLLDQSDGVSLSETNDDLPSAHTMNKDPLTDLLGSSVGRLGTLVDLVSGEGLYNQLIKSTRAGSSLLGMPRKRQRHPPPQR